MSGDFNEDIYEKLVYMPITLFSESLRVGIIGGGRGAYIKAKSLSRNLVNVEVLSKEFISDFKNIPIKQVKEIYNKKFIKDKHIVIIAISDEETINRIINDCKSLSKIYINSSNYKKGMGVIPVKRESKNMSISINTKIGNPKGAVMVADKLEGILKEYDDFIDFTGNIRNKLNIDQGLKLQILSFINNEDFKYIFDKGKGKIVLDLFYKENINGISFSHKKE